MRVGFIQFCPERGNKGKNIEKVCALVNSAACDLWVLPELFNTGYLFSDLNEARKLAEEVPSGQTTRALLEIASKNRAAIVAGLAERDGDILFNSSVLVGPDGEVFSYRKLHLFGCEKDVFEPGDREPEVFEVLGVKVGMMICFDWYFPETARILTLKGAQIVCHPANLILPYCQKSMPTRCLENRVFAITANRIGTESIGRQKLTFTGWSLLVDPLGNVLARASNDGEEFRVVDIDPQASLDKRLTSRNDLRSDRRVELYGELLRE